jgi:hypothetical protein
VFSSSDLPEMPKSISGDIFQLAKANLHFSQNQDVVVCVRKECLLEI